MPFGSEYGKKEIISEMMNHSVVKKKYSNIQRKLGVIFGLTYLKIFGIPNLEARIISPRLSKMLNPRANERVLDIGCGAGFFSVRLAFKYECNVTGIDIDSQDIKLANFVKNSYGKNNLNFKTMDVIDLDFHSSSFDKVICLYLLEHISDDERVIKNISKVLKKNGILVIYVPTDKKTKFKPSVESHVREGYSIEGLKLLLERNGYRLVKYEYGRKPIENISHFIEKKTNPFVMFPILYPLSKLGDVISKSGVAILAKFERIS